MTTIDRAIQRNVARKAKLSSAGKEDTHFSPDGGGPAPAHTNPSPAFPAQDVSVPLPVRGTMPVGTVLDSDLNIANRAFRAGPVRSAVFTNPATTAITGSSAVSKLQAQVEAAQTQSETATTAAAQATAAAGGVTQTAAQAAAAASAAQSTANGAQTTANNALPTPQNLSYRPLTNPLTSVDAGGGVSTVSVSGFSVRIRSNTQTSDVVYSSGSVASLNNSTVYYLYMTDSALAGGAVTYQASATKTDSLANSGNLFIGSILTAAAGGSATAGNNDGGVGGQSGNQLVNWPTTNQVFSGTWSNPTFAYDADPTTATITGSNPANIVYSGFSSTIPPGATAVTLVVDAEVIAGGGGTLSYSTNGGASFTSLITGIPIGPRAVLSFALPVHINPGAVQIAITNSNSTANNMSLWAVYLVFTF